MDSGYIPEALIEETRRLIEQQRAQAVAEPAAAP
jgi:hypothetical protein